MGAVTGSRDVRLVVKPHRPVRQFVTAVVCIILMVLAGWLLFDYGKWRYIYERMAASGDKRELWKFARQAETDNENLRGRLAIAQRTAEVDREALSSLQSEIRSLQSEILDLREELEFYRNTVTGENASTGLNIHSFRIYRRVHAAEFGYKLVLTHVVPDDGVDSGTLDVQLKGSLGKESRSFSLSELQPGRQEASDFEIRHFRRIEGKFVLPERFEPAQVIVTIRDKNKKKVLAHQTYDWALVAG